MGFRPIQQGQLELGHAAEHIGVVLALAHFGGHVSAHVGDPGVALMLFIGHQQIQLAVFLDLHTQVVQALDGGVAGKEILGPGTEGDDLQALQAQHCPGNGHKLHHLVSDLLGVPHRVLGDVALQAPQAQVVGAVEHPAIGVATAVDQVAVALGSRHKHTGAVKVLGDEGFGGFGTKVAQKDRQSVAASPLHFLYSLEHILFIFHSGLGLVDLQALPGAGGHHGGPAALGKPNGETVTRNSHNAQLHLRDVVHVLFLQSKNSEFVRTYCEFIVAQSL